MARNKLVGTTLRRNRVPTHIDTKALGSDFATRLHRAMQAKNISQSQLATAVWGKREVEQNGTIYMVSKNRERISVYLKGRGFPNEENLARIAEVLGVRPEDLSPPLAKRVSLGVPDCTITMLNQQGERMASLSVQAVLPAQLALKIAQMIEEARQPDHGSI